MQKSNRYIFLIGLLLVFLLLAAGCERVETPQKNPVIPEQQVQGAVQGAALPAGEAPRQQGETNPQIKDSVPGLLSATVTYVVDGDTVHIVLAGGKEEKVRFIGVDTPESTKEVEPYGKEAAAYTKSRLDGRKVWLEKDVAERDKYGRLLAYVWISPPTGAGEAEVRAKMFNAELLLNGYAQVMT
ncbi:MAG: thermonuclease family protein, partial [Firmicutes bacterium]|nr:thermonuclease family protein [Bacillota bacterium]